MAATKQSLRAHKLKLREPTGMEGEGGGRTGGRERDGYACQH